MFLAELLSRAYLRKSPEPEDKEFEFVKMASWVLIAYPRLEEMRQEIRADESMQVMTKVILQVFSASHSPSLLHPERLNHG